MNEANDLFEWTNCCRLCLTPTAKLSLLESDVIFADLSSKIYYLLHTLIYRGDPMPQKICVECLQQLNDWNTFRNKCLDVEKKVKNKLRQMTSIEVVKQFLENDEAFHAAISVSPSSLLEGFNNGRSLAGKSQNSPHITTGTSSFLEKPLTNGPLNDAAASGNIREILPEVVDKVDDANRIIEHPPMTEGENNWETVFTVETNEKPGFDEPLIKMESVDLNTDLKVEPECENVRTPDYASEMSDSSSDYIRYNLRPRSNKRKYDDGWSDDEDACQNLTPWKCDACCLHFSTRVALTFHQSNQKCRGLSMQSFPCNICRKKFFSLEDYAEHNVAHLRLAINFTSEDLRCCDTCGAKFADPNRFDRHLKIHSLFENRSSVVSGIQEPTTEQTMLAPQTHISPPAKKRMIACSLCVNRFQTEDLLYDHRFAIHGIPDERVACIKCSVKFRTSNDLNEHLKTHNFVARKSTNASNVSLRCRQCGLVLNTKAELEKHEAIKHIPFSCRECQRPFPTRSALLLHYRTHSKTLSGVGRPPNSGLKPTELAQEVENPKCCRYCNVEFKFKSDYDIHYSCHIKFKKNIFECDISPGTDILYQCSDCPYLFVEKIDIANHCREKHNGKECRLLPLKSPAKRVILESSLFCRICNLDFSNEAALTFHKKKKHPSFEMNSPTGNASPRGAVLVGQLVSKKELLKSVSPTQVAAEAPKPSNVKQVRELWEEEKNKIIRPINGIYCCTLCHIQLGNAGNVKDHKDFHTRGNLYIVQIDESIYQCTVCDLTDSRDVCLQHVDVHSNDDFKVPINYSCPFCDCQLPDANSVEDHIVDEHAED